MAGYFNRTRGPITVSLKNGDSAIVGPKATLKVTPEQDGSASLHAMVRRKLLVRLKEPVTKPVVPEPDPVPVPPTSPPSFSAEESQESEDWEEPPSLKWTKAQLSEYATDTGLEVPSSWTKVEIIEAIEAAEK